MTATAGAELSAAQLAVLLRRVHEALRARRDVIDALNVFPVPDGDTGTNMTSTIRAGLDALGQLSGTVTGDDDRAREVLRAIVRGARGNSGVILSQVVRGFVEALEGAGALDAPRFADALEAGRRLAYDAVAEPVEGTMLTAITAAADAARMAADAGADLHSASASTCTATAKAVEATVDQLDVLHDYGVVDAGARGFEVVLAAVHGHLTGKQPPVRRDTARPLAASASQPCRSTGGAYEVQYVLSARDGVADELRRRLENHGDSVVVVSAGDLLNVHVHTDQVEAAIDVGAAYGTPDDVRVVDLAHEVAHRTLRTSCGVVAVVDGPALVELVAAQGVVAVEGRPGALPSVADLVDGVLACGTDRAVILPGHRNVTAAAGQASAILAEERDVDARVVETADNPPAMLAAVAVVDPEADLDRLVELAMAAAGAVRSGAVVSAVRDASTPAGPLDAGQPLAVDASGTVLAACDHRLEALDVLCDALDVATCELVTVLVAEHDDFATAAVDRLRDHAPDAEVELVVTGQRAAILWVGAE